MTIDEAISHAREVAEEKRKSKSVNLAPEIISECELCAQEHDQLVEWLEELQQYRAIGTPEECRAAVERNNEKTRIIDGVTECCGYDFGIDAFRIELSKFCPACGRKIERSDEE